MSPATASLPDNALSGTVISTASITMSDGSAFSGALSAAPVGTVVMSGNKLTLARNLAPSDDGTVQAVVTASENGGTANGTVQIQVTPTGCPPPPPPPGGPDQYQQQLLDLINNSRAAGGLPAYAFSATQSQGTSGCIGSYGHSLHMSQTGVLAHDQFPADICLPYSAAGENIGEWSGPESSDITNLHQLMINEGPGGGHYQNIMSQSYTKVGIGLVYTSGGVLWLTEDFVGP
jgi:uncharacterized protein YkwD